MSGNRHVGSNPTLSAIISAYSAEFLRNMSVFANKKMVEKTRETSLGDMTREEWGLADEATSKSEN